ncbi:hypothetical protein DH2020_045010 [Rehmannia glutinosa]|uniref:Pentatricopeptide repeat-containing protein n=1 Tax=Rehmannia glutinosa TaxID=99300 RepID=A0ABR0UFJ4_REHGL
MEVGSGGPTIALCGHGGGTVKAAVEGERASSPPIKGLSLLTAVLSRLGFLNSTYIFFLSISTTTVIMTLCRLLLRSVRRYSSTSNPFPFHSPFPTSAAETPDYPPPTNPQYTPNPPYPNPPSPNQFYSPVSSANTAADAASNYHHNPHIPAATPESSSYYQNPQFSAATATNASNYQYNNQIPAANEASNYHNPQFSTASATNQFQFPSSTAAPSTPFVPQRSYGFSSAEEAAAERRRRKRRLRIEPPLYALRPNPPTSQPNANNPDKPRLPDSTSALVGPRLNLHNRVQSLIRAGDLDSASYDARQSVFQSIRPTVFTCNAIIAAMYRASATMMPKPCSTLKVYEHILENAPYSPSAVTYRHLTNGLIDAGRINDAVDLLREMLHKGHGADSLVFNNVILGFLNLGNLDKANELFDELKERCTGKPKEAMESYRDLMARNYRMVPATRNVLLETLLRHGKKKEAWDLFHDMLDDHTPPTFQAVNSDTFNMMINELFKEGNVAEAMDVFKREVFKMVEVGLRVIPPYANKWFGFLIEKRKASDCLPILSKMADKEPKPDVTTYDIVIRGLVEEGTRSTGEIENILNRFSSPFPPQRPYLDHHEVHQEIPQCHGRHLLHIKHLMQINLQNRHANPIRPNRLHVRIRSRAGSRVSRPVPEQEAEFPGVAGQNAA